jgi:hypothetical protein
MVPVLVKMENMQLEKDGEETLRIWKLLNTTR